MAMTSGAAQSWGSGPASRASLVSIETSKGAAWVSHQAQSLLGALGSPE